MHLFDAYQMSPRLSLLPVWKIQRRIWLRNIINATYETQGTVLCVTSISTVFVLLPQHREPSPVLDT